MRNGIFITNHIQLSQPLDDTTVELAKYVRWQWIVLYNHLKAQKGGGAKHAYELAVAEQVIDAIDAMLVANPTTN